MNLKFISDSDLLNNAKRLAHEERRIGIQVLHHLREIDSRKLFASIGFSSLFSYCTGELGYSEGGAYRRIAAMRLLREVPEYEAKLQEGTVTVATLSQVQSFLVQEKRQTGKSYSSQEKMELLGKIEGKSTQQTERVLATISPQSARVERERAINEEETEIRFTASRNLMAKIERLKNLLGHKPKAQSYVGLIEELVDLGLKKLDPQMEIEKIDALPPVEVDSISVLRNRDEEGGTKGLRSSVKRSSRYVPVEVRRLIWKRDEGRCTFVDTKTLKRCESRHALELEHIQPFALGGKSQLENLKLFCPAHNQLSAIQRFGLSKMQRFWKT